MNKRFLLAGALIGAILIVLPVFAADTGKRRTMMDEIKGRTESGKYDDISGKAGNGPNVGEIAPDFSLMPLKFYEFGIDEKDITAENAGDLYQNVTLSDFKGKKPVVLIFESYT